MGAESGMTKRKTRWLGVREPLPARHRAWLTVLAFVIPLGAWCAISYLPFVWHPLVLVTDAGDTSVAGTYDYLQVGQQIGRAHV